MNVLDVFLNNIASLALIPIVIVVVLKIKNVQIDSLREQNNVLKEQAKVLGLFRVSEVEKDIKALKNLYETKKKEADRAKNKLRTLAKKLENVKPLSKKEAEEIVKFFEEAMDYMNYAPSLLTKGSEGLISQQLYMMKGPIGDLWREAHGEEAED